MLFAATVLSVVGIVSASSSLARNKVARSSLETVPLYQSVEDPADQWRTRVLVHGNAFLFGGADSDRKSLLQSDQGFPIYFVKIPGALRVQGQPIIFPDGSLTHFELEELSCTVLGKGSPKDILCRNKANGHLYHSRIASGGLVSFDMRCFGQLDRVCHYELIGGSPLRAKHP
jgi:hypothetical protein